jgi:hypothetical protein
MGSIIGNVNNNNINTMSKFKEFWKGEIATVKSFKEGDRVKIHMPGTPDHGKSGTVSYVNSGGGVKVNHDNGDSETYSHHELRPHK